MSCLHAEEAQNELLCSQFAQAVPAKVPSLIHARAEFQNSRIPASQGWMDGAASYHQSLELHNPPAPGAVKCGFVPRGERSHPRDEIPSSGPSRALPRDVFGGTGGAAGLGQGHKHHGAPLPAGMEGNTFPGIASAHWMGAVIGGFF